MRRERPVIQAGAGEPAPRRVDRRIARLAASQHGVLTYRQFLGLGCSRAMVEHRAAAGWLHRVFRGVYAVGHPGLTQEGRWLAAVLAAGPGALLSHRSAAALWRIRGTASTAIDVISPTGARRMCGGLRSHRSATLAPADATERLGIPCTTAERTLLDLGSALHPQAFEYAIHRAQSRKGLIDTGAMLALLERSAGRPGVGLLRQSFIGSTGDVNGEFARRFLPISHRASRAAGAPPPRTDHWIAFSSETGGNGVEVDFAWPERRLAVETDGRAVHGTARAFENDRARDRRLLLSGWLVMRFTWRQVVEGPAACERELAAVLRARPVVHAVAG